MQQLPTSATVGSRARIAVNMSRQRSPASPPATAATQPRELIPLPPTAWRYDHRVRPLDGHRSGMGAAWVVMAKTTGCDMVTGGVWPSGGDADEGGSIG